MNLGPEYSDLESAPSVVIEPRKGWRLIDLGELCRYKDLLYFLVWRNVKILYKQTVLGFAWAIIRPLFSMIVFSVVFGRLAKIPSDGIPYPIFSYAALVPWTYFATAMTGATNSLTGNANLITKVYFPRILIPTSVLGYTLLDFALGAIVFVPLMGWYGVGPGASIVALPVILAGVVLASLGVGVLIAALNVKYRDFRYVAPFLVQLWLFATPVIYPASVIPRRIAWLVDLNPMAGLIENFRACLLNRPLHAESLLISLAAGVVFFGVGFAYFRHVEDGFADIL